MRTKLMISAIAILALAQFAWPLLISADSANQAGLAQVAFAFLMPGLLVFAAIEFSSGSLDARQLAVLAVLTALNSIIRMLGAGTAGIETVFFIVIVAAYVFGSSFGFLLGSASLLTSGVLSGGVGPWLPFQMMAAGLIGIGAGMLPRTRRERPVLIGYAIVASFVYGGLMTLWNWPVLAGTDTVLSYAPGEGFASNVQRFISYEFFTGGLLWDAGRAITTSILIWLTAPALITTLKRAATRARTNNR